MNTKYGKYLLAMAAFLILLSSAPASPAGEKDAGVHKMAVVNGTVITDKRFNREFTRFKENLAAMGRPIDDSQLPLVKKQVMENIIGAELLYQQSQKDGVTVESSEIDTKWEEVKSRFPSETELNDALKKMDVSETIVRSQIKYGLAIQKFIERQVIDKVAVSDTEVKDYYNSHPDKFKQPAQVKASHILIKVDADADESLKKTSRKEIEKIQKKLKGGEDFAALAKEFSKCPSSARGGDLGYFANGQMVKPFEEAAFALKPGEISDIVETRFGYHLIKVTGKRDAAMLDFETVKDRLKEALKQEKGRKDLGEYVEKLRAGAKVEIFDE